LSDFLAPLKEAIQLSFLPNLCSHPPSDQECSVLALPVCLGGLVVFNPCTIMKDNYDFSASVTSPLSEAILQQCSTFDCSIFHKQQALKKEILSIKWQTLSVAHSSLSASLLPNLKCCLELASEKRTSFWLTALPLECHSFVLHKGALRDAMALWYGWPPPHHPSHCVCGKSNSVEHALSCPNGAFPSIRCNALLSETCHDVSTEPSLQPLSGESLSLASANTESGVHLDIKESGCQYQPTF